MLNGAIGHPPSFIDVGAYDGVTYSNTRALVDLGWSGLMIEPGLTAFQQLLRNYADIERVTLIHAALDRVNARLLDRLSGSNSGTSEYVKPDEDIEGHVGRFYARLTSPVLADLRIELAGMDLNRTYPRDLPDLFEGGQIVWVGRNRQSGRTSPAVTGVSVSPGSPSPGAP